MFCETLFTPSPSPSRLPGSGRKCALHTHHQVKSWRVGVYSSPTSQSNRDKGPRESDLGLPLSKFACEYTSSPPLPPPPPPPPPPTPPLLLLLLRRRRRFLLDESYSAVVDRDVIGLSPSKKRLAWAVCNASPISQVAVNKVCSSRIHHVYHDVDSKPLHQTPTSNRCPPM